MDNNVFDGLVASLKKVKAIKRKEIKASRGTKLELRDINEVSEKTGLSQTSLLPAYILVFAHCRTVNKVDAIPKIQRQH